MLHYYGVWYQVRELKRLGIIVALRGSGPLSLPDAITETFLSLLYVVILINSSVTTLLTG